MNEAYSDIWGETVDMLNTRQNEGGDTQADKIERTEGLCSEYTRSAVTMEITAPASVDGPCNAAPASFGPVITQAGVSGTAIVGVDGTGTLPDGTPDDSTGNGCLPFTNAGDIAGQWVYVDRGSCTFQMKADNAEDAGALGIVVGDNVAGREPISMSGIADIYGVMVTLEDGQRFKSAGAPVDFNIAAVAAPKDDTYRWLSGETDPAFGGAIRDMWNPNCYGDPGSVSDAEYHCDESDSGGVHSNSGVVNRTFAILVDGLDGKVTPIGLNKAAWLFWYSQVHYLTPSSYFPDLADALEASCAALQGVNFEKVTLGNPSDPDGSDGGVVDPKLVEGGTTATDCNRVKTAIAETELRLDPPGAVRVGAAAAARHARRLWPRHAHRSRTTRRASRTVSRVGPRTRSSASRSARASRGRALRTLLPATRARSLSDRTRWRGSVVTQVTSPAATG